MHYGLTRNRNALAWLMLMLALALHVADEAMTGFLPFYNEIVFSLREAWGFFPAPVFSFELWLGGLVIAVIAGFALTFLVASGGRTMRLIAIILGVLMAANGAAHLLGSLYFGFLLPGVTSAPLVLASALLLTWRGLHGSWSNPGNSASGGSGPA